MSICDSLSIEQAISHVRRIAQHCVDDANQLVDLHLEGERLGVPIHQPTVKKQFAELNDILKRLKAQDHRISYMLSEIPNEELALRNVQSEISSPDELPALFRLETKLESKFEAMKKKKTKQRTSSMNTDYLKSATDAVDAAWNKLKRTANDLEIVGNEDEFCDQSIICPFTGKMFVNPVMNQLCRHTYEKDAVEQLLTTADRPLMCPYNCRSKRPILLEHLLENKKMKRFLRRQNSDFDDEEENEEDETETQYNRETGDEESSQSENLSATE